MHDAPLMLSVSGARGIVGETMTPLVAARYAASFGRFVRESTGRRDPTICLGRDSRPSGQMLSAAAASGLLGVGCRVVDIGVVATPTVAVMIGEHAADGGMAITASHNPAPWNGLKSLTNQGLAPPKRDADRIIEAFRDGDAGFVGVDEMQTLEHDDRANDIHVRRVLDQIDPELIRRAGFRVVLDSINGGGAVSGGMLLDELGCNVTHLNGEPTGRFAHTPEPKRENLGELAEQTAALGAAVGFAQDPDADRLAIVDERGRYIGEEYTLVLAARAMLEVLGRRGPVAANLSTSRMIDDLAGRFDCAVHRSAVGEANVAAVMQAQGAVIGGEGNGGVILPDVCWVRDSLSAMALVLTLMASERRALSELVDEMPSYAMFKQSFDLTALGGLEAVGPMLERVQAGSGEAKIDSSDGVRLDWPSGWVHLRPSNTEPIVRLIGEADDAGEAKRLIEHVTELAGLAAAGSR